MPALYCLRGLYFSVCCVKWNPIQTGLTYWVLFGCNCQWCSLSVTFISDNVHKWVTEARQGMLGCHVACANKKNDSTLFVINADIYTLTHTLINSRELFIHEWWASDGRDLITPVVCPGIAYSPPPCPFLLCLRQSISLWKWHFKRLIALWPSLSDSDRWQAESGAMVLHVSCISQHGSWSQHTRWICCSICCHRVIFGSLQTGKWTTGDIFQLFFPASGLKPVHYVVLVEDWSFRHYTHETIHMPEVSLIKMYGSLW